MRKQRRRSASHNCEADQHLCIRYTDSRICLLFKSKISSSVCVGPVRKPHCWFSHEAAHLLSKLLVTNEDPREDWLIIIITTTCIFSACRSGEFQCVNGDCIPESERCDNKYDCRDRSDEENCRKLFFTRLLLINI